MQAICQILIIFKRDTRTSSSMKSLSWNLAHWFLETFLNPGGSSKKDLVAVSQERVIDIVVATNLTADDLRNSRLPEDEYNIWMHLTARNGDLFRLVYSTCNRKPGDADYYPRVGIDGMNMSRSHFETMVSSYFTPLNHGRPIPGCDITEVRARWKDDDEQYSTIFSVLLHDSSEPITQQFVARMADEYTKTFAVEIPAAYYYKVPVSVFNDPGFDRAKLREEIR